jgi:hypothetical protein
VSISGDYAHPVTVNGFSCKNCTDVDYAKKHIDPARPKDGPYGLDAKDKTEKDEPVKPALSDPASGTRLDVYA